MHQFLFVMNGNWTYSLLFYVEKYKWSLVHAEIMWYKNMRTDNFLENWNKFQAITDDNERQND